MSRRRSLLFIAALGALLIGSVILAVQMGAANFSLLSLWRADDADTQLLIKTVLFQIRIPRVVMAGLTGATLGVAGAIMQGFLRNPLADPGLIGVSSGAALAAVFAIVYGAALPVLFIFGQWLVPLCGILGSACVTLILYGFATRGRQTSLATIILAGVAISAFAGAVTGMLTYSADDRALRDLTFWLLGSFSGVTWPRIGVVAAFALPALCGSFWICVPLNAMLLGEADAMSMGYPVERTKRLSLLFTAALVGPVVSMVGSISFVGVVVPHLVRLVTGPDHRYVMLGSGLLGAALVEMADLLARTLVRPAEMPVGILTAFLGAPVFVGLLMRSKQIRVLS